MTYLDPQPNDEHADNAAERDFKQECHTPPKICAVETIRERELAQALRNAIEWIEEAVPGQNTHWWRNVLSDSLMPGEKSLCEKTTSKLLDEAIARATVRHVPAGAGYGTFVEERDLDNLEREG